MENLLDVGCGDGASLQAAGACPCRFCVGVDVDMRALQSAKRKMPWAHFVIATGEYLPFKDEAFDRVTCIGGLVLMPIRPCLGELGRVVRQGGTVSVTMHDLRFALKDIARVVPLLSGRALVGRLWAIINGWFFILSGRNYRFPKTRGINGWETWQTRGSMRRAFRRAGFVEFRAPVAFNAQKDSRASLADSK